MESRIKEYVGKRAFLPIGEIRVMVKISDIKVSWGHERVLITPVSGEGKQWVGTEKLQLA